MNCYSLYVVYSEFSILLSILLLSILIFSIFLYYVHFLFLFFYTMYYVYLCVLCCNCCSRGGFHSPKHRASFRLWGHGTRLSAEFCRSKRLWGNLKNSAWCNVHLKHMKNNPQRYSTAESFVKRQPFMDECWRLKLLSDGNPGAGYLDLNLRSRL